MEIVLRIESKKKVKKKKEEDFIKLEEDLEENK